MARASEAWRAVQRRSRQPAEQRQPINIYLDEWQTLTYGVTDLADVLARSRGYAVGWCLANQSLAQLSPSLRTAALVNARSKVAFQLAADDAAIFARITDQLDARDFQSLDKFEIYASLVVDQAAQPFCSATTRPLSEPISDPVRIRDSSRAQYGVPRDEVEAELRELAQSRHDVGDGPIGRRKRGPS